MNFDPIEKYGGVGGNINWKDGYLVVMQHPVTNEYKSAKEDIIKTIEVIYELNMPTFWFWPNVDAGSDDTSKGIRTYRELVNPQNIHFFKNMEPNDFLRLLVNSKCLIGNSSVGIRECSYLGVPTVNIGTRQNKRQRGTNVLDVIHDKKKIKKAILNRLNATDIVEESIYGTGKSGGCIADVLANTKLSFHKTISY